MSGPIPESVTTACVAVALFAVMFSLGLTFTLRELHGAWRTPGPLARGLFAVLVAVPLLALGVVRVFDLPRLTGIGIVLMAISPGGRAGAGGHRDGTPASHQSRIGPECVPPA